MHGPKSAVWSSPPKRSRETECSPVTFSRTSDPFGAKSNARAELESCGWMCVPRGGAEPDSPAVLAAAYGRTGGSLAVKEKTAASDYPRLCGCLRAAERPITLSRVERLNLELLNGSTAPLRRDAA